jgi:hypothetical protein
MYTSGTSIQLFDAIYHHICCRLKENVIQYKVSLLRTCGLRYGFLKKMSNFMLIAVAISF